MLPLPTWISALIPPYMATLILPLPLNIVTQQTEESKRAGEILENFKLGCVSSKDSSDTDTDTDTDTDAIDTGLICMSPFLPVISAVFNVGVSL
jgi:hypothetical protein